MTPEEASVLIEATWRLSGRQAGVDLYWKLAGKELCFAPEWQRMFVEIEWRMRKEAERASLKRWRL